MAAEYLRRIRRPSGKVFPWAASKERLYREFHRIQTEAGVEWPWGDSQKQFYGFRDFRRAFATMNAPNIPAEAVQRLMRHKSYATTQRYINMARSLGDIVGRLTVPEAARAGCMRETMREGQKNVG